MLGCLRDLRGVTKATGHDINPAPLGEEIAKSMMTRFEKIQELMDRAITYQARAKWTFSIDTASFEDPHRVQLGRKYQIIVSIHELYYLCREVGERIVLVISRDIRGVKEMSVIDITTDCLDFSDLANLMETPVTSMAERIARDKTYQARAARLISCKQYLKAAIMLTHCRSYRHQVTADKLPYPNAVASYSPRLELR
jgi:hypothetical protein